MDKLIKWRKRQIYKQLAAEGHVIGIGIETKAEDYVDWAYRRAGDITVGSRHVYPWHSPPFLRFYSSYCFTPDPLPHQWPEREWWDPYHWSNKTRPYQIPVKQDGPRFYPGMTVVCVKPAKYGWAWGPEHTREIKLGQRLTVTQAYVAQNGKWALTFLQVSGHYYVIPEYDDREMFVPESETEL
jgi:hypothetical protein